MPKFDGVGYFNGRGTTQYWGTSFSEGRGIRLQFRSSTQSNVTINAFKISPEVAAEIAMHFYKFRNTVLPKVATVKTEQGRPRYWLVDIENRMVTRLTEIQFGKEDPSIFIPNPVKANNPDIEENIWTQEEIGLSDEAISVCGNELGIVSSGVGAVGRSYVNDDTQTYLEPDGELSENAKMFFNELMEDIASNQVNEKTKRFLQTFNNLLD